MPLCFSAVLHCGKATHISLVLRSGATPQAKQLQRWIDSMWESQEFFMMKKSLSEMTLLELWKSFTITLFSENQAGAENKLP